MKRRASTPSLAHRSQRARKATAKRRIRLARPAHIRIALHPLSMFTLLIAGVLITGWTFHTAAASYTVNAKVPAAPLTEGAVITSPADGLTTSTNSVVVSGTCPDTSYVTLMRNGIFSGVSACAVDHTFSISTALAEGANLLVAQDYNITDDPGPATPEITVNYAPPPSSGGSTANSGSNGSSSTGSKTIAQPLLLVSDYRFKAVTTAETFSWNVIIKGGQAPYTMDIDWGDGGQSIQTYPSAQLVTLHHDYKTPGYFTVIVDLTDGLGSTTTLQLLAFIKAPGTGGILFTSGNISGEPPLGSLLLATLAASRWLLVAWPSYVVVVLMVSSFWLGERQELRRLLVHPRLNGHASSPHRR